MPLGLFLILLKYALLVALMGFVALVLREMMVSLTALGRTEPTGVKETAGSEEVGAPPSRPEVRPPAGPPKTTARPGTEDARGPASQQPVGGKGTGEGPQPPDTPPPPRAVPEQRPGPQIPAGEGGPPGPAKRRPRRRPVPSEEPAQTPPEASQGLVRARLHEWAEETEEREQASGEQPSEPQSGAAVGAAVEALLEVTGAGASGLEEGLRFPVGQGVHIGRASSNDVVLPDSHVSRQHAYLGRRGERWVLVDKGSVNGTAVNGRRVTGPVVVNGGDVVAIGSVKLVFRCTGGTAGD
ncbi:MAG: FHA domain-containing protein [Armatimonadetes bacterium]|nr:FHA domain-containing protein [Armatimonadota bacterium]